LADLIPVHLTLVSASPRRRELLEAAGYRFDIRPTRTSESWTLSNPLQLAKFNAEKKVRRSEFFASRERLLLGADTIVAVDHRVFGKPAGVESAGRMLKALSGRSHSVITGICVSGPAADINAEPLLFCEATRSRVTFVKLTDLDIHHYLLAQEWDGKAGAYAIQGLARKFVKNLSGDYENVVGLPLISVRELITRYFSHCQLQP
jgi:septum formation protein